MKKFILIPVLAASAVAMATPSLAQNWGADRGIQQRQAQLERRVERMAHRGDLNRTEYRMFRRLFAHVDGLERQYRRDGLQHWERRELNAQLDRIQYNIRAERREERREDRWERRRWR